MESSNDYKLYNNLIDIELLKSYGATEIYLEEDTYLFRQGEAANLYYQLIKGEVNIFSIDDAGNVFTQSHILDNKNKIFGFPSFFTSNNYPSSALAKKTPH